MALLENAFDTARVRFKECLEISWRLGAGGRMADCLEGFAGLAVRRGKAELAAWLLGRDASLRPPVDRGLSRFYRPLYERHVAMTRAVLGPEAFAAAWEHGRTMSLEALLAFALEDSIDPPVE